jgi:hypothetical protein
MERLTRLFDADWIAGELLSLTPRLLLASPTSYRRRGRGAMRRAAEIAATS